MKKILIVLLYIQSYCTLYSQVDSSAASFFPAAIGNSWHYQYTQTQGYITTLTRDSVANGSRYLFFDSSSVPLYKIDSSLNVIAYPNQGTYEELRYKLTAKKNETWLSGQVPRIVARVDDEYWGFVLGKVTQIKRIGYYYQQFPDTTLFSSWQMDLYIAAGFGFYLEITDAMQTPSEELYGCIINGITYGTMTSVKDKIDNSTPTYYKLYPSFPNPFNPSTTISYYLHRNNNVKIVVYSFLGKEVETIIDRIQAAGLYSVSFKPKGLSSGVYFVRMSAGQFTQTTKIIYSK